MSGAAVVVLPTDHRLVSKNAVAPQDIVKIFIGIDHCPHASVVIDNYLKLSGMGLRPAHSVDNLAMAMSLIASTGGAFRPPMRRTSC
jgi:LysR family hca operon transcriptional activator